MAAPLPTSAKQSVDLTGGAARVSKIRRDPPPAVAKKTVVSDREEVDQNAVLVGILLFALVITVIVFAVSYSAGWSPREVVAKV